MADEIKVGPVGTRQVEEIIPMFQSQVLPNRWIRKSDFKELQNPVTNAVISLAIETAMAGYGALIFCSNRKGCESLATLVSRAMPSGDNILPGALEAREDVLSELRSLPIAIDETLGKTVMRGVAFHRRSILDR